MGIFLDCCFNVTFHVITQWVSICEQQIAAKVLVLLIQLEVLPKCFTEIEDYHTTVDWLTEAYFL